MSLRQLELPDESLLSLKLLEEATVADIRLAASLERYEKGRLSSGVATRAAGIPRTLFLVKLTYDDVDTFRLSDDDLQRQTSLV